MPDPESFRLETALLTPAQKAAAAMLGTVEAARKRVAAYFESRSDTAALTPHYVTADKAPRSAGMAEAIAAKQAAAQPPQPVNLEVRQMPVTVEPMTDAEQDVKALMDAINQIYDEGPAAGAGQGN